MQFQVLPPQTDRFLVSCKQGCVFPNSAAAIYTTCFPENAQLCVDCLKIRVNGHPSVRVPLEVLPKLDWFTLPKFLALPLAALDKRVQASIEFPVPPDNYGYKFCIVSPPTSYFDVSPRCGNIGGPDGVTNLLVSFQSQEYVTLTYKLQIKFPGTDSSPYEINIFGRCVPNLEVEEIRKDVAAMESLISQETNDKRKIEKLKSPRFRLNSFSNCKMLGWFILPPGKSWNRRSSELQDQMEMINQMPDETGTRNLAKTSSNEAMGDKNVIPANAKNELKRSRDNLQKHLSRSVFDNYLSSTQDDLQEYQKTFNGEMDKIKDIVNTNVLPLLKDHQNDVIQEIDGTLQLLKNHRDSRLIRSSSKNSIKKLSQELTDRKISFNQAIDNLLKDININPAVEKIKVNVDRKFDNILSNLESRGSKDFQIPTDSFKEAQFLNNEIQNLQKELTRPVLDNTHFKNLIEDLQGYQKQINDEIDKTKKTAKKTVLPFLEDDQHDVNREIDETLQLLKNTRDSKDNSNKTGILKLSQDLTDHKRNFDQAINNLLQDIDNNNGVERLKESVDQIYDTILSDLESHSSDESRPVTDSFKEAQFLKIGGEMQNLQNKLSRSFHDKKYFKNTLKDLKGYQKNFNDEIAKIKKATNKDALSLVEDHQRDVNLEIEQALQFLKNPRDLKVSSKTSDVRKITEVLNANEEHFKDAMDILLQDVNGNPNLKKLKENIGGIFDNILSNLETPDSNEPRRPSEKFREAVLEAEKIVNNKILHLFNVSPSPSDKQLDGPGTDRRHGIASDPPATSEELLRADYRNKINEQYYKVLDGHPNIDLYKNQLKFNNFMDNLKGSSHKSKFKPKALFDASQQVLRSQNAKELRQIQRRYNSLMSVIQASLKDPELPRVQREFNDIINELIIGADPDLSKIMSDIFNDVNNLTSRSSKPSSELVSEDLNVKELNRRREKIKKDMDKLPKKVLFSELQNYFSDLDTWFDTEIAKQRSKILNDILPEIIREINHLQDQVENQDIADLQKTLATEIFDLLDLPVDKALMKQITNRPFRPSTAMGDISEDELKLRKRLIHDAINHFPAGYKTTEVLALQKSLDDKIDYLRDKLGINKGLENAEVYEQEVKALVDATSNRDIGEVHQKLQQEFANVFKLPPNYWNKLKNNKLSKAFSPLTSAELAERRDQITINFQKIPLRFRTPRIKKLHNGLLNMIKDIEKQIAGGSRNAPDDDIAPGVSALKAKIAAEIRNARKKMLAKVAKLQSQPRLLDTFKIAKARGKIRSKILGVRDQLSREINKLFMKANSQTNVKYKQKNLQNIKTLQGITENGINTVLNELDELLNILKTNRRLRDRYVSREKQVPETKSCSSSKILIPAASSGELQVLRICRAKGFANLSTPVSSTKFPQKSNNFCYYAKAGNEKPLRVGSNILGVSSLSSSKGEIVSIDQIPSLLDKRMDSSKMNKCACASSPWPATNVVQTKLKCMKQ